MKDIEGLRAWRVAVVWRKRSWPVEPRLACEVLRAVLPGWRVSHARGRYRATLVHGAGRSTVEAREASVVAVTIETLFDIDAESSWST
ncbi:hypothetical protein ACQP2E_18870 [Actinoplanes sp. CA-015351]|uniref:hypothetical protein n=1 Tax=Actinoplanes sp. CA-015351 TaxID=3239897 RepID=UPI003D99C046